jgi:hypothetical protein
MQNSETQIHRRNLLQWAAGTSLAATLPAWAQATWPSKPVNLIVPFLREAAQMRLRALYRPFFQSSQASN